MQADSGIYVEDEQVEVAAVKAVSKAGRWTAVKPVSTTAPRRGSLNKQDRKQSQATIHEAFEKANDPRLLFNSVDEDHSGNIDFEEFRILYDEIREHAANEALKDAEAKRKLEMQEQRAKFLKAAVTTLLIGLAIMLMGNMGLTAAVVFLSKDTAVDGSGVMTVAGSSEPIRVASSDFTVAENAASAPPGSPSRRLLQQSSPPASAVVGAGGAILQMSQASVDMPLFVLPAMDADQLSRMRTLSFKYKTAAATSSFSPPPAPPQTTAATDSTRRQLDAKIATLPRAGDDAALARRHLAETAAAEAEASPFGAAQVEIEAVMTVASVHRRSPTSVTVKALQAGVQLTVADGLATYEDLSDPSRPISSVLCFAKASCAAVSVRADEAEALAELAITSLVQEGLAVPPPVFGFWTGLTGGNSTPWANGASARALQVGIAVDVCAYLSDKRYDWCSAGWTRMAGSLDYKLAQLWSDDFNMFYSYGTIVAATDWWTKDGVMLPIKASWKWYDPDASRGSRSTEAYACSVGYREGELFYTAGGTVGIEPTIQQRAMFGVNSVCADEARNRMMDAAAQCINDQMFSCMKYARTEPHIGNDGFYYLSEVDYWMCTGSYSTVSVYDQGEGSVPGWRYNVAGMPKPVGVEAQYFLPASGESYFDMMVQDDPCDASLKARRGMATRSVLQALSCRQHDAYGGAVSDFHGALLRGYDPFDLSTLNLSPAEADMLNADAGDEDFAALWTGRKADFWDGTSLADISYSAVYGAELPAFEGYGYQDGQGTAVQRSEACTFETGIAFKGQPLFLNGASANTYGGTQGRIDRVEVNRVNTQGIEQFKRWFMALWPDADSIRYASIGTNEASLATDVTLSCDGDATACVGMGSAKFRKGLSRMEGQAMLAQYEMCFDRAQQYQNSQQCESIQFTSSVWRGVAPPGQSPGWECLSDLDDYDPPATSRHLAQAANRTSHGDVARRALSSAEANEVRAAVDERWATRTPEGAQQRRKLRHGCANSRSGCRVLPPPRR